MNNSTSCDYHASEPDSVYNLKSLICLYDVSLLPINFNLEYKIFDKNDKKQKSILYNRCCITGFLRWGR